MGGTGRCLSGIERLNKTRLGVKVGEKETSSEAHGLRAVDTWEGFVVGMSRVGFKFVVEAS